MISSWKNSHTSCSNLCQNREPLLLRLFDPFESRELTGVVVDFSQLDRKVKLDRGDKQIWIKVDDILGVEAL